MTAINRAEQLAVSKPNHNDDDICNSSSNPSLNDIIEARMSRRGVFRAAVGTAGTAVLGSLALSACGGNDPAPAANAPPAVIQPPLCWALRPSPKTASIW